MASAISDPSVVVASQDQFSCPLGSDTVILDVKAGLYFSLDNVGAFVWQLIQQPRSVKDLRQAVGDEFEVDADTCERDLHALLGELAERKLIQIQDAAAA
jgi:hypothetical protein